MGKASRAKRERREGGGSEEMRRLAEAAARKERRQLPVFWIVIGLLLLAGLVALVATRPDDDESAAAEAAKDAPVYADVEVTGDQLPKFPENPNDDDPAVGETIPTVAGTLMDGAAGSIAPDGTAKVVVTVAHWCPHCQAEVPRIVEWANDNLPDDVEITTVSTSVSEGRPNFPPAAWLAKERWEFPAIVDDEAGSAADAFGVRGFPFVTFVNADGTVSSRFSGEMEISAFADAIDELDTAAPAAEPVPATTPTPEPETP